MSVILKKYKGESTTFGFVLPDSYDLANMQDVKIYIGSKVYSHVMDNVRTVKAKLASEDTQALQGRNSVIFHIDDAVFGIRKILVGEFQVDNTTDNFRDESVNLGYDVLVMLKVEIDTIEVDSIFYNVAKGDSAFTAWQKLPENVGKDWNDYIAYLREPMTQAIADGEQTVAEWAIAEAERVAEELIRKGDEEERRAAEVIREQVKDATIIAKDEAIQATIDANDAEDYARIQGDYANTKGNLADAKAEEARLAAINADNKAALANTATTNANDAAALANSKAGIAQTAADNANAKATLANTAATNANTVATNVANAEAARVLAGSEVKTNMSTNIEADKSSTTKYPQLKALYDWATGRFLTMAQTVSQTIGTTGARLLKLWTTDIESTNMPTVGGVSLSTTFASKSSVTDYISLYSRKIATVVNGVITAIQDTIDAHNSRVTADSGAIRTQSLVKRYYDFCYDNQMFDSIKFAWFGDGGSKFRTSGIYTYFTKIYSMLGGNDASQVTSTNQPYLSGNIAPNEKYGLKNPNGGSNFLTHSSIVFNATDKWTVTEIIKLNGFQTIQTILTGGTNSKIRFTTLGKIEIVNESNAAVIGTGIYLRYIGKRTVFHFVANGNGSVIVYVNGVLSETITIASNMTFTQNNSATNPFYGILHSDVKRAHALTQSQITSEYNFFRAEYTEIPSVIIGTQTWATSNLEIVTTPQGNVIPEVQVNATWATSQTLYDSTYAATSGTVEQKTYAAVKAAAMWCHYNNDSALGAVYGKLYNWFAVKLLQMDIDYYNANNPSALWGWRVSIISDFTTLQTFLGGSSVAGAKMKKEGTNYWFSNNGDNTSGFSFIGTGRRNINGTFSELKDVGILRASDSSQYWACRQGDSSFSALNNISIDGCSLRLIKN